MNELKQPTSVKGIILVVDDEPYIRELLVDLAEERGFRTLQAENGQQGLQIMAENRDVFGIISDIRMPVMDGAALYKELVARGINTPFVMVTGHSDVMDMETAYKMGVTEFLMKPFSREEVHSCLDLVEHVRTGSNLGASQTFDYDYCRVHIDEFMSGSKTPSDVFLKVGENKYLKIAKKESPLSAERVETYRRKGLAYFYLKKEDFAAYVGMNLAVSKAISKLNVPKHRKLAVLKHTLEMMVQDTYINGMDKQKFNDAKSVVESTLNLALAHNDLFNLLEFLKTHSDATYAHSLAVSIYASAVCDHWGWKSASVLNKIALAGLFHDIGKKELPQEIVKKPRMDMTAEDIQRYETHCSRGAQLLTSIPGVPEEVVAVASQHHENMMGTGFPHGLNRMRIHPFAKVVGTVNVFVDNVLKAGQQKPAADAFARMVSIMKEELDVQTLKALMVLFNFPVPKEFESISSPNINLK